MKKQTFFPRLGLVWLFFLVLVSCQKDETTMDQDSKLSVKMSQNDNSTGGLWNRMTSNCECEYQITGYSFSGTPSTNHIEFFLAGVDQVCDENCRYFSAALVDCQSPFIDPDCDDIITGTTNFKLFKCSVPPNSNFDVALDPYWLSSPIACSSGSNLSGTISFRVRCMEKPLDNCSFGFFTSNTKTISYPSSSSANVTLAGCGCEPTIY